MATCPNCGEHIAWWNLKADCKKCGVSIPNHDWVNRLEEDNQRAEEQFLKFYKTMNRVKYSLWGTKLRIARLILTFIPAIGFILPWADIKSEADSFQLTLLSFNHSKSAIDILLQIFKNMSVIIENIKFEGFGGPVSLIVLGTLFYFLSALFIVIAFFLNIIKCAKPKTKSTVTTDIISIIFSVLSVVFFSMTASAGVSAFSVGAINAINISGGISWGYFVALLLLLGAMGINIAVAIAPAKTDEELENERLAKVAAKEEKEKENAARKEQQRKEAEKAAEEEQKRIVEEAKRKVAERKAKEEAKANKK